MSLIKTVLYLARFLVSREGRALFREMDWEDRPTRRSRIQTALDEYEERKAALRILDFADMFLESVGSIPDAVPSAERERLESALRHLADCTDDLRSELK